MSSPVVEKFSDCIWVVRDDLLLGGTKRCFADELIFGFDEVVYASPAYGGAQVALAHAAKACGVRLTLFIAKRKDIHPRTREAMLAGANVVQVPYGYMSNVKAKALQYCDRVGARLLPFGLNTELAAVRLAQRAMAVREQITEPISELWCAAGSGTLARSIGGVFHDIEKHAVQVGCECSLPGWIIHKAPEKFEADAKQPPPFNSCSNYDAKVWRFVRQRSRPLVFWNVAR